MLSIPVTFERAQWPVGHGGFHTGKFQVGEHEPLLYFFDCGGQNKQIIDEEFKNNEYEFGVLSHLHSDHLAKIASAKVKKVFLPYLGPIGWLYLIASHLAGSADTSNANALVRAYGELTADTTKEVIWVGRSRFPGEVGEVGELRSAGNDDFIGDDDAILSGVLPNAKNVIGDSSSITLRTKHELLVRIKFFNFRQDAIAAAFESAVQKRLDSMRNLHDKAYENVQEVWEAIEAEGGPAIERLTPPLKDAYNEAAKGHVPRVAPLNLSSLTMWTSSLVGRRPWKGEHLTWLHTVFNSIPWDAEGWMLTGDLELTDEVWPEFSTHFFHEIPRSLLFNVPHHGSKDAIGMQAAHNLIKKVTLIACVPTHSKHHPSDAFVKLLADYQAGAIPVTQELDTKLTYVIWGEIRGWYGL